jgi:hypothetical protein
MIEIEIEVSDAIHGALAVIRNLYHSDFVALRIAVATGETPSPGALKRLIALGLYNESGITHLGRAVAPFLRDDKNFYVDLRDLPDGRGQGGAHFTNLKDLSRYVDNHGVDVEAVYYIDRASYERLTPLPAEIG